jgi:hypothetical protein
LRGQHVQVRNFLPTLESIGTTRTSPRAIGIAARFDRRRVLPQNPPP